MATEPTNFYCKHMAFVFLAICLIRIASD